MEETKKDEENNNQLERVSWWSAMPSWLQTAKERSSTAIEFMKRDLTEFSQVVQTDGLAAVTSTAAMLKEKLTVDNAEAVADKARQSITSVIGTLTDVFVPQREIEDTEEELMIIKDSEPVTMDWWQKQLYLIRRDSKTFCREPEGPPEMYEKWLESFDPEYYQEDMTEAIMASPEVQSFYDKLVPASVSHSDFWQRYFYRVHLLHKAEAKREELMKRAEQVSIEDLDWNKELLHDLSASDQPDSTSRISRSHSIPGSHHPNVLTTSDDIPGERELKKDVATSLVENQSEVSDTSRSSPIESLGKESASTSDDWEKDFDLESENDLKKSDISTAVELSKEEEDEWEKWQ